MKITPDAYQLACEKWAEKRSSKPPKKVYSAAELQSNISNKFETKYFKYIPCPICNEDKFTVLHEKTKYSTKKWQNFIINVLIQCAGNKVASAIISLLMRRRIDLSRRSYRVAQCVECDFIYRNPTYLEEMLQEAYNKGDYSSFLTGKYSEKRLKVYESIIDQSDFDARTANFNSRKILDIGCGFGLFLNLMKDKGWEPYGLDFAEDSIALGKKKFGLNNINVGNLNDDTFKENTFDAVSLISVAAHLEEPMAMFQMIHKILKPGGLLLIWTVNAGGLEHKYDWGNWHGFSPNHLIFFDSQSINNALKRTGFSHIDVESNSGTLDKLIEQEVIPAEHEAYFSDLMQKENLGGMLVVLATNGE